MCGVECVHVLFVCGRAMHMRNVGSQTDGSPGRVDSNTCIPLKRASKTPAQLTRNKVGPQQGQSRCMYEHLILPTNTKNACLYANIGFNLWCMRLQCGQLCSLSEPCTNMCVSSIVIVLKAGHTCMVWPNPWVCTPQ